MMQKTFATILQLDAFIDGINYDRFSCYEILNVNRDSLIVSYWRWDQFIGETCKNQGEFGQ